MLSINDKIDIIKYRIESLERSIRYLKNPGIEDIEANKGLNIEEKQLEFIIGQEQKIEALNLILNQL
jgi:regulator of replication initiation timing